MAKINLGKKSGRPEMAMPSDKTDKMMYPDLHIHDVEMGMNEKHVGKPFTATITGKVSHVSKSVSAGSSPSHHVGLEIHSINMSNISGKSMQKQMFDSFYHGKKK